MGKYLLNVLLDKGGVGLREGEQSKAATVKCTTSRELITYVHILDKPFLVYSKHLIYYILYNLRYKHYIFHLSLY